MQLPKRLPQTVWNGETGFMQRAPFIGDISFNDDDDNDDDNDAYIKIICITIQIADSATPKFSKVCLSKEIRNKNDIFIRKLQESNIYSSTNRFHQKALRFKYILFYKQTPKL